MLFFGIRKDTFNGLFPLLVKILVGFDVANVRGTLPQAVQHILDVGGIQLQKPLLHQRRIKLLSADAHEAALCAEDLQHEVRDLVSRSLAASAAPFLMQTSSER